MTKNLDKYLIKLPNEKSLPLQDCLAQAQRLAQLGKPAQALSLLQHCRSQTGPLAPLDHLLALLLLQVGEAARALPLLKGLWKAAEGQEGWRAELLEPYAHALLASGALTEALPLFQEIAQRQPEDFGTQMNLGNIAMELGRFEAADAAFERAATCRHSEPVGLLKAKALLNQRRNRPQIAEKLYKELLALRPEDAHALNNIGTLYKSLGRLAEAAKAYKASLKHQRDPEVLGNLAWVLERLGHFEEGIEAAEEAEKLSPGRGLAAIALAKIAQRMGERQKAISGYRAILERAQKAQAAGQISRQALLTAAQAASDLGNLLEREGDYDQAWKAFDLSKAASRSAAPNWQAWDSDYRERMALNRQVYEAMSKADLPEGEGDRRAPVFLLGFPRSGTSLLDISFDRSPDCRVMDEEPVIQQLLRRAGASPLAAYHKLQRDSGLREELRQAYWQAVEAYFAARPTLAKGQEPTQSPQQPAPVLIDKMPLNTPFIWLIKLLFADAKIIFCLRDPRDVLVSCQSKSFHIAPGAAGFADLESSAKLYTSVMDCGLAALDLFGDSILQVTYETLVKDPATTLEEAFAWAGLTYSEETLGAAPPRVVNTPSYDQVTKPLYRHAIGRWKHYEAHLRPSLELLWPYSSAFGYE